MVQETRKIMHQQNLLITATCVRVPVYIGHGEAVNLEFETPMEPAEAKEILASAPGVSVIDNPSMDLYPLPVMAAGLDDVFVGRIRKDVSSANGLALWVVADNLRKGAALNAVQIAEMVASTHKV